MVVVPVHTRSIGHVVMSRSAQEMLLTHSLVYYSTQLAICPVRNHMCLPVIVLFFLQCVISAEIHSQSLLCVLVSVNSFPVWDFLIPSESRN